MIDNLKGSSSPSPAAEKGCRLTAMLESGELSRVDLDEKKKNFPGRKRLHARRLKQSSTAELLTADCSYYKKKKPETGGESLQIQRCRSHGSISLIGRRREMEDAVTVKLGFMSKGFRKYDFFGVYDGHGGSRVAHECRDLLHRFVAQVVMEEEESSDNINWEKVMAESFSKMDEEVKKMATMGSTAVVAVVGEEEIVIANCGDSRAVLSRGGVAMPLSNAHKPDRPDELERIENSGGKVINWNGQRVLGVLATSRSIGDAYLKPYVIPDPEVIVSRRNDADEFLILASDGLWDVVPNNVACDITRRCLNGHMRRFSHQMVKASNSHNINGEEHQSNEVVKESPAAQAATLLAEVAIARGSKDNISVIVLELKRSVCSATY